MGEKGCPNCYCHRRRCGKPEAQEVFQKFIAHPELKPLQANSPESLVTHIKWASTAVLKSASQPPSQAQGAAREQVMCRFLLVQILAAILSMMFGESTYQW